jgi:bacterioferritin
MKGSEKVISILNSLLSDELTAINQYMVHSEMCENWGYPRLHDESEKRAIAEMKHAEKLIARILFLEGVPEVSRYGEVHIGKDVQTELMNDLKSEADAIKAYNKGIAETSELQDNGTSDLLQSILEDEEKHIDWLESQLDQIAQIGIQNYLSGQVK